MEKLKNFVPERVYHDDKNVSSDDGAEDQGLSAVKSAEFDNFDSRIVLCLDISDWVQSHLGQLYSVVAVEIIDLKMFDLKMFDLKMFDLKMFDLKMFDSTKIDKMMHMCKDTVMDEKKRRSWDDMNS